VEHSIHPFPEKNKTSLSNEEHKQKHRSHLNNEDTCAVIESDDPTQACCLATIESVRGKVRI